MEKHEETLRLADVLPTRACFNNGFQGFALVYRDLYSPMSFSLLGLKSFFVFQLLLLMRACSCTLICRASHPSGISRCVLASPFSATHVQYAAPLTRKRLFEPGSGSGSHPYRGRTSKDISAELTFVFSELLTCDHNKTHLNAACKQDRSQMERKHQQSTHSHVKHIF